MSRKSLCTRSVAVTALVASLGALPAAAVPLVISHQGYVLHDGLAHNDTGFFKFALVDSGINLNNPANAFALVAAGRVFRISVVNPGLGYVTPPSVTINSDFGGAGASAQAFIADGKVTEIIVTSPGTGYNGSPQIIIDPPTGQPTSPTVWSHDASSTDGAAPVGAVELPVDAGLYSVALGDIDLAGMTEPITAALLAGRQRVALRVWFSVSGARGSFERLRPDIELASAAYALRAAVAETVPDDAIGARQLAASAVTSDKLAVSAVTRDKLADGAVTGDKLDAPGIDRVPISDGNGGAVWRSVDEFLLAKGYTPSLPGVVENLATLEVSGIFGDTVQIVNGPGVQIEDLGGSPGRSGLNAEFEIVFDYDGPSNAALQGWLDNPSNRSGSIIVRNPDGGEVYRWNFFEFRLTSITSGTGNGGKNRYVMRNLEPADNLLRIQRLTNWLNGEDRRPGDTRIEISNVPVGPWPMVQDDPSTRTLTLTFDYSEGGQIWTWVVDIATNGASSASRRSLSLIYEDGAGAEIGRNNYFEAFPTSYQHFTGFDLADKGSEQVVLSYDFARNADGSSALYAPPAIEYFPGTPLMATPYDLGANALDWEISGIAATSTGTDTPVLLSGPGYVIERIAGFDADGKPADHSGNQREFPLVVEVGGPDLAAISSWRKTYLESLPLDPNRRAISLLLRDAGGVEQFRWNLFEMLPFDILGQPNGRARVTFYHGLVPDNQVLYLAGDPPASSGWGTASMNNPANDVRVEIESAALLFAATSVDTAERTVTLIFDFGEGGDLLDWARQVGNVGTTGAPKRSMTVLDSRTGTNYFGVFPIAVQHFTGFEQAAKGRAKMVLSYDRAVPALR